MNVFEKIIERIRPAFSKGGPFAFLHSTFDAFETFLLVPGTVTRKGSHIRDCNDLKRVMIVVVIALVPCLLFGMYNTGLQHYTAMGAGSQLPGFFSIFWYGFLKVLPLVIVSYIVGLGIEFTVAQIRGHEVNEGYLVTGMLIPLIVPVTIPLWMLALAVAFSVLIGKEIFGGTGMNIWNPALLARAFLFFSYPGYMTGDKVWIDGFTGATPLASWSEGAVITDTHSWTDMFLGFIPGSVGETSVVCILLGAAILLYTGVASWKIMLSCVAGAALTGLLGDIPVHYHLVAGGFAFGCVFMATDPVTSPQTETGKWIYGFLTGALTITIRLYNPGYPEGMMLAILLMNTFSPLIDHTVVSVNVKRRMKRIKAHG
ncbi:MAG: NADH:ubiquinone reductase (Na(+)-transporting) subunit B [Bacteroidales bacterium]|jgi:Na+-transporting NADH:ubiquinone oxidoreductase subunit B|nr:NADH:ubiquinone reductase (Na(+)-transporting) subunit B [Bacteroidales bacterium]MDD2823905.1 NADH:ubiquinone reductase (Na(+)-transporting) subunit B [Bacteroidales bacterium]MDD3100947.1 NADH:ubiquinone reductase (Na(+)-transporting) subunit B [Bacteroidales bacterium]MDD3639872.1 NADH:ubiquinone reductase (Na(+)-transporting) subunit B [Bacteroidales bacterium]MDD3944569.1 NADH:ubiquinone reductase (Na(+)-transporting) subunit B [Bacteroidales bacterium]